MSRSVDYLTGAEAVAYIDAGELEDELDWDMFKEDIEQQLISMFPSLDTCDRWDGRETHIFLENDHAEIGISEYCGLVSVSVRAKDDNEGYGYDRTGLAQKWVERVKDKFLTIGTLNRVGTFSNGEAVFERKEAVAL